MTFAPMIFSKKPSRTSSKSTKRRLRKINKLNIKKILSRVGEVISNQQNQKIAEVLGVSKQACSNWKTRGAIPWVKLFKFSQKNNISFDWLLTGKKQNENDPKLTFSEEALTEYECLQWVAEKAHYAATQKDPQILIKEIESILENLKKITERTNQACIKKAGSIVVFLDDYR